MKKIFLLALIFISFKACSQRQPQSLGSPMTDVYSKGTIGSDSGHVFRVCRTDTTAWNFGLIKNIPGVVVRTCDDLLWLRNNTAVKWVLIGTGAGSTDSSWIIIDSTYDDLAYSPNIDSMYIKSLRLQVNGITLTPTSDNVKLSYDITAGSGIVINGANGVTDSSNTILLGGTLYKNTTINTAGFTTTFTGVNTADVLDVTTTSGPGVAIKGTGGSGRGVYGITDDGFGLYGLANTSGFGVFGSANTGVALTGFSSSGLPGQFLTTPASTNTVIPILELDRSSTGAGADGIGSSIDLYNYSSTSVLRLSNQFISKFTTATNATRNSQAIITGVTNAVTQNWLTLSSGGALRLDQYGAGTLTTDASGNVTAVSDVRLKNVKGKFRSGLSAVMNINPIVYKWNDKSGFDTKHNYIGFSAQNIQSVLGPDAVGQDSQGYLSIQDRAIMAALVNAIKEQQREIENLQKQINALKLKNDQKIYGSDHFSLFFF